MEQRYQLTKDFPSFYFAQIFIKAFQMYYRLRKIRFGPFRGRSRLQLKQNSIGQMDLFEYLFPPLSKFLKLRATNNSAKVTLYIHENSDEIT